MPENKFGERIHNFFGQDGLSQDQHQFQAVHGSWSGFSNGLVSNQRQINASLTANLNNYLTQQSVDSERGQSSNSQHGMNFIQKPMRSEYARSVLQEHQLTNGYMHGNLGSQASPNEAIDMRESPVNYDLFGGQQQLNTQQPGLLQPIPGQQMSFYDMQQLKHQAMLKQMHEYQMHEYQMQQQLQKQQLEARQLNSSNSNTVNGSRLSDNQSHPLIGGVPLKDASNNWLQPDLLKGTTNWMHSSVTPVIQGSSSELMVSPEQGQLNLLAQESEPSLYGPVSSTNAPQNAFSFLQINRVAAQHGSANKSSSLTNQPTSFLNQADVQGSHMLPRSTYQEKMLFSRTIAPCSDNGSNFENFQQDDSRQQTISRQENFYEMEGSGLSERSFMKVPENINTLPKPTTLDPTEEKILFGSDDNLWEAFENSTDVSLTGSLVSGNSDLLGPCPSLQSGSWSALMQSAVEETSSNDTGIFDWDCKQQSLWANNNSVPHANSRAVQDSGVKASNAFSDKVHSDSTVSTVSTVRHLQDKGTDHSPLERPMTRHSQMAGNMFHSLSSGLDVQNNSYSIRKNEDTDDRPGNWKADCNPSSGALMEQKNHFTQNLKVQWPSYSAGNDSSAARDVQENTQWPFCNNSVEKAIHQLNSGESSQILESYESNNVGKVMADSNELGNSGKENSSDSFRSKFTPESLAQLNAHDLSVISGGKETQAPPIGLVMDGLNHKESTNHMLLFGQTVSQSFSNNNHAASDGADHQQISSQIAPSSYSQYEAFKNWPVQPVNDTGRSCPLKIGEQHSNVWNSVDGLNSIQLSKQLNTADPGCIVPMQQMSSTPGAETLSSVSLPHIATDQLRKVDKPKKRKTATSELVSWNKEIMQGSKRLKTLGEADVDWARATNRYTEKVEVATLLEDGSPIRSKKRLIYTTQIMQQLFGPPPGRVISVVASSNYECVAYTAGRYALGDACSSCCTGTEEGFSPPNDSYSLSEKSKTEKISDQYISKAAEDFISRTKKLETYFAGLENGTTITDLRFEVQDLERFAVINRFASFHKSPLSMDRTLSSVRVNPQRYVSIAPMPQHIPDMVQCLSF